jgi:hypothetical protein
MPESVGPDIQEGPLSQRAGNSKPLRSIASLFSTLCRGEITTSRVPGFDAAQGKTLIDMPDAVV